MGRGIGSGRRQRRQRRHRRRQLRRQALRRHQQPATVGRRMTVAIDSNTTPAIQQRVILIVCLCLVLANVTASRAVGDVVARTGVRVGKQ